MITRGRTTSIVLANDFHPLPACLLCTITRVADLQLCLNRSETPFPRYIESETMSFGGDGVVLQFGRHTPLYHNVAALSIIYGTPSLVNSS